jgi:hypothetical protein
MNQSCKINQIKDSIEKPFNLKPIWTHNTKHQKKKEEGN